MYCTEPPWSACQLCLSPPLIFRGDLRLHLPDQGGQFFLALRLGFGVDIPCHAPTVDDGGVAALPQVGVDPADAAGARLAPLAFVGPEGAGRQFLGRSLPLFPRLGLADAPVDLVRRALPHGVGDVGVGVQGGGAGYMADDGAQSLDVHPVLQGGGGEGVPEIVEPQTPALRPLQHRLEALSDGGGVHGGVLLHGRGEHPPGVHTLLIGLEHVQDRGG